MDKTIRKLIKILLIILIVYILIHLYQDIGNILKIILQLVLPFIVGFTGAFILDPIVSFLTKKGFNRKPSAILVVIITFAILVSLVVIIIPIIGNQLGQLLNNIPNYIDTLKEEVEIINNKLAFLPDKLQINMEKIELFLINIIEQIMNYLINFLQTSFSYILSILITPILIIYFLLDFNKIKTWIKNICEKKQMNLMIHNMKEIEETLYTYIKGVVLVTFVLSLCASVAFMLIGLDLAILWGIIIGITDIIPYFGPYIGGGIVVLFALTNSVEMAISVLLVIVLIQFLEGNILTPNIHSKTIKTHPILVIFSVAIFGKLLGIIGMIIAIPVLSIVQIIIKNSKIWKK